MAKKDYEVLGLSEDADEKAVKRAYFRLVRQFSPEKDPERFQEIREAYENITSGKEDESKELMLGVPDDPYARKIIGWLQDAMRAQDAKRMVKMAEEAISASRRSRRVLILSVQRPELVRKPGKSYKNDGKAGKKVSG